MPMIAIDFMIKSNQFTEKWGFQEDTDNIVKHRATQRLNEPSYEEKKKKMVPENTKKSNKKVSY